MKLLALRSRPTRRHASRSHAWLPLFLMCSLAPVATQGATIWNGPRVVFTKAEGADSTQAANQDRLTSNVWLTRGTSQGLYNAAKENSFSHSFSPADTEWATGSTANYMSLNFTDWESWARSVGNPPATPGVSAVLHLKTDDIYLDVKFLSWSSRPANGGGFSYERSTPGANVPVSVAGACGASNGGTVSSAPSSGLCSSGTASTVSGSGPWTWTCAGENGGSSASCAANATSPVNGECGSSNGASLPSTPASALCTSGFASAVSGTGPWNWSCSGSGGGTTSNCSALLGEVQVGSAIGADNKPLATATSIAFGLSGNQLPIASGGEVAQQTSLTLGVTISVDEADRNQLADLLAVALLEPGGLWFMRTDDGWKPWNGELAALIGHPVGVLLQETVNINLASDMQLPPADYSIYSGYRLSNGRLVYSPSPLKFNVR